MSRGEAASHVGDARGQPDSRADSQVHHAALEQDPFSGHVFVFRGRRGDLVKLLWWDGDGLCLFAKRLERGRFVWPQAQDGTVALTRAQLAMLPEGIDCGWGCSRAGRKRRARYAMP